MACAGLASARDVAQRPRATRALVAEAERAFGGCDILINNAGTGSSETILEAPTRSGSTTGTCT